MSIEARVVLHAIAIGVGASLFMDIWNLFLKHMFRIPSLNYCLLGRWLLHMPDGTFRHAGITVASKKPFECWVGWIAHYACWPSRSGGSPRCRRPWGGRRAAAG